MSSLSTMTVGHLSELANAPVVHPTGSRKSKLTAIVRMASIVALKEALAEKGLKKKSERKAKKSASAKKSVTHAKRKNFTFRRLVARDGCKTPRGENGSFLRVAIDKETRKVSKVNEKNWSDDGNKLYKQLYSDDTDYKSKPSPSKLTSEQNLVRKATKAFNKEIVRRVKVEKEWSSKYGLSFDDFNTNAIRIQIAELEEEIDQIITHANC